LSASRTVGVSESESSSVVGISLGKRLGAGDALGPIVGESTTVSDSPLTSISESALLGTLDGLSLLGAGLEDGPRVSVSDTGGIITSLSASITVGVSESASDSVEGISLGRRLGAGDALGPIVGDSTVSESPLTTIEVASSAPVVVVASVAAVVAGVVETVVVKVGITVPGVVGSG
jgi:hypothetical protein